MEMEECEVNRVGDDDDDDGGGSGEALAVLAANYVTTREVNYTSREVFDGGRDGVEDAEVVVVVMEVVHTQCLVSWPWSLCYKLAK